MSEPTPLTILPTNTHRKRRFKWGRKYQPKDRRAAFLLPHAMTVTAMCSGMSSIRFSLMGQWEKAVAAILLAALLDGMDGRLARILGTDSAFGAQLDSLADLIAFGVAPSLLLYTLSLQDKGGWGWACVLFFTTCMALRLSRFFVLMHKPSSLPPGRFSIGVPAPAGALIALLPLITTLALKECDLSWQGWPPAWVQESAMIGSALLMISRIPTFVMKNVSLESQYILPLLGLTALSIAGLLHTPWTSLSLAGIFYLLSIPFSVWQAYKKRPSPPSSS